VVTFVFPLPPAQIHPDGFGYLSPRPKPGAETNKEGVLGVVFDSTALPGLDEGLESKVTKLTVMMGGPYWSDPNYASGSLSQPQQADELVPLATAHLHKVFPHLQQVDPLYVARHLHTNAIPTYVPGHFTRLNQLHTAILQGPWRDRLSLTGNGYGGVGVNDCVWSAETVVEALARGQSCTGLEAYAEPWSP
jgi:oxygen-dependent protoporphyrinogen oxidase